MLSRIASRFSSRGNLQNPVHVEVPGLADRQQADTLASSTLARPGSLPALRPARLVMPNATRFACLSGRSSAKESRIGRIGTRPPAFDIVDAELVERAGDLTLVLDAEIHALRLRTVTQGCIEQVKPVPGHAVSLQDVPCAHPLLHSHGLQLSTQPVGFGKILGLAAGIAPVNQCCDGRARNQRQSPEILPP
jgi:hypothetical protein